MTDSRDLFLSAIAHLLLSAYDSGTVYLSTSSLVMLKLFYSHIRMSVDKIRIYLDIRFSVLIS